MPVRLRERVQLADNCAVQNGGAVAQLGERRVRNAEVVSSILIGSTNYIF